MKDGLLKTFSTGKRFPRTYQLADVFEDTDIVQEVVRDLEFQERLERLSKNKRPFSPFRDCGGGRSR